MLRLTHVSSSPKRVKMPRKESAGSAKISFVYSVIIDTINDMTNIAAILEALCRNPHNVRFADLAKLCDAYFGEPRQKGTSHRVYRTPWPGDPRVNIQSAKGKAKPYQVRQVIKAIEKLEGRQ